MVRSYAHSGVCIYCKATKQDGPLSYADFRDDAAHRQHTISQEEFFAAYNTILPILALLPGFCRDVIKFDWMHTNHLGVMQMTVGNCLMGIFETGMLPSFHGRWIQRLALALRHAWLLFKKWGAQNNVDVGSQPCFTPGMLCMASARSWPEFKGKASNCGKVCRWLLAYHGTHPRLSLQGRIQANVLKAHVEQMDIINSSGT